MAGFDSAARKVLWERAGHRCSKCGRGTSKPNPDDPNASLILGEGAHVHGDKPTAPRYLASQTEAERNSPANGVWLCERCHNEMDKAFAAYPAEVIRKWKLDRECATARDASSTPDEIGQALALIEKIEQEGRPLIDALAPQQSAWSPAGKTAEEQQKAWREEMQRSLVEGDRFRSEIRRALDPQVGAVVAMVEGMLGVGRKSVVELRMWAFGYFTNPLAARAMLAALAAVRHDLQMR